MIRVALLLAKGFEEIEAIATVDILRRAGIAISLASIEDNLFVDGAHNIRIIADVMFDDLDVNSLEMVILPGGMPGSSRLLKHSGVIKLIQMIEKSGKFLAAICAAPIVLAEAGVLINKNAVCYPGFEPQLGGANLVQNGVVVDGSIITAKGVGLTYAFAFELVSILVGKEIAKEVQRKMLIPDTLSS